MRILQLIQKPQLRGAEIFACHLSSELVRLGVHVDVAHLFYDHQPALKEKFPHLNFIHVGASQSSRLTDLKGYKNLKDIIKGGYSVVQANAGDTLKYAAISKLLFGWKAKLVFRNANKVSDFINSASKLLFNKLLVNQLDYAISVSDLCKKDFVRTFGFALEKITSIPIGVECNTINASVSPDIAHHFQQCNVLVNVASLVPEKNQFGLLAILKKVSEKLPDTKLLIVGDGKLRLQLEGKIKELDLSNKVKILGYRGDVLSIIKNARALLLPSKIEGLPGVILEAMYCKTPVVAYDVGGISEVVKNGETGLPVVGQFGPQTGWLVNAGDEEGFVRAVNEVLKGGHDAIIENAYNRVVRDFDNREIAKRFLKVYAGILNF